MEEIMEEQLFEPQYPAGLYTKRPNATALLSPLYDYTFKGIFTQETEESNLALRCFISAVLNFHYKNNDKKEMRWYTMTDDSKEKLEERLNIIFIDLVTIRKLKDKPVDQLTPLEKWGLFFSYVDHEDKRDYVKSIVESEQGIMEADKIVQKMSDSDDNWFVQNSLWIAERDRTASLEIATKKGLEQGRQEGLRQGLQEGRQQGIQEGIQQSARESAIAWLKKGMSPEDIAECEGLPLETVLELQKKILVRA